MLVKANVTGRNMQVDGTANPGPYIWALLTHDIAKILADIKDLQNSSCKQFSSAASSLCWLLFSVGSVFAKERWGHYIWSRCC